MKNWIWWWRQNWNGATILLVWSTKLPSVEPWQEEKGENFYTERKTEECFQRKTIGFCSRRDACSFPHTHATGDCEDNVGWSGGMPEIFNLSKHTLQYRKWRNRMTRKAWTVWRPVLRLKPSSRMSWLQVWKQMHSWLSLLKTTCWCWEVNSARGREKKVLKDKLLFWERRKRPRLCISRLRSNEFYPTESWRIGIERFGGTHQKILRMHLVQNWIRERKWQFIQKGEPHERITAK